MLSDVELKLLKKISESNIITKGELVSFLEGDGIANPKNAVDSAVRSLHAQGLVNSINPIGASCVVITQNGAKALGKV